MSLVFLVLCTVTNKYDDDDDDDDDESYSSCGRDLAVVWMHRYQWIKYRAICTSWKDRRRRSPCVRVSTVTVVNQKG